MDSHLGSLDNGAPRQRRFAPRTRTGCVPCRRRRKRCPGELPACQACIRLNIDCTFDSKRRVPDAGPSSRASAPASTSAAAAAAAQAQAQRAYRVSPTPAPRSAMATTPAPANPARAFSMVPVPASPPSTEECIDQGLILSYYIHAFVPNISVAHVPSNYFLSVYVPMAFRCEGVLDAVVAAAAAHLSKMAADGDRKIQLLGISLRRQARCHAFLQQRISLSGSVQRDLLEAMTIILLLIGLEVQNGSRTTKWVDQLGCLRRIIKDHGGRDAFCSRSWEAECIYQHFLYHDVMGLIMAGVTHKSGGEDDEMVESPGQSPAVPSAIGTQPPWEGYLEEPAPLAEARPHLGMLDSVHPLLGLSKHLFFLIQKIRRVKVVENGLGMFMPADNDLFCQLEREIVAIKFDLYPASTDQGVSLDVGTRLDLLTLAETYRLAALILLYRRSNMHAHQLPVLARNIMFLVDRIPSGNSAEAGLTYPLFLAGGELILEEDILKCASKLISIRERVKVRNIESVEAVLQEVWRERLNGGAPKDWENVLKDWRWVINVG